MLTDAAIRAFKPGEKSYKKFDRDGLHLVITPSGGKLWRFKFRFEGREKLLSFGPYPDVSLSQARGARDDAKATLRKGEDPSATKRAEKAAVTSAPRHPFEEVAREWFEVNRDQWAERHAHDVLVSLERDVFPFMGSAPIADISASDVYAVVHPLEQRGAKETARRVRQRIEAVFARAIAKGIATTNPGAQVKGAMAPMAKGRQPAIIDLEAARAMLAKAEAEPAHPVTKLALRILALTAVRPGTLASTPWAEWSNLDADAPAWQVPAERMKMRLQHKGDEARDHIVPLSRQAVEAIAALQTISGRGRLAFPNTRHAHKPMSENAMGYLLNRAGYHHKHVPHGWRATFSSVMNERFPADRAVIDLMLAHVPKDAVEGAYNRALHMARRRELAQLWADLILDGLPPAEDLLSGPRR
ncbi:integrase arm-type DNA-binding domain-containing protein [Aquibium sp. ELW1220]|uniref:tyrosine-type recombinase/integrase n=1 Tax=Aquibium sp. ELW1220 TaxID=2976766 RepID=UPI0025AEE3E5|nr:integrase arm-type DNA-binding domain-containing protein [Aquibium sp. ELW1220]MDN2581638.1 integrase arm-type DNA-binding domain-containing protein [Aquibium sp. ELW1220]